MLFGDDEEMTEGRVSMMLGTCGLDDVVSRARRSSIFCTKKLSFLFGIFVGFELEILEVTEKSSLRASIELGWPPCFID